MAEVYLGQIILFAGNFTIRGFAQCNGAILSISQNTALFSLLGTTYGGNGTSTFGLPDLRGRVPLGMGSGPGLQPYVLGQASGSENVTLLLAQMPQHNHFINVQGGPGTAPSPSGNFLATTAAKGTSYETYNPSSSGAQLNTGSVSFNGSTQPHSNLQPYLTLNYQIATQGIFPSRN